MTEQEQNNVLLDLLVIIQRTADTYQKLGKLVCEAMKKLEADMAALSKRTEQSKK